MKNTKLVMLGVLTSSLYASGFYGGIDIGTAFVHAKSSTDLSYLPAYDSEINLTNNPVISRCSKTKVNPGLFIGYKNQPRGEWGG